MLQALWNQQKIYGGDIALNGSMKSFRLSASIFMFFSCKIANHTPLFDSFKVYILLGCELWTFIKEKSIN